MISIRTLIGVLQSTVVSVAMGVLAGITRLTIVAAASVHAVQDRLRPLLHPQGVWIRRRPTRRPDD